MPRCRCGTLSREHTCLHEVSRPKHNQFLFLLHSLPSSPDKNPLTLTSITIAVPPFLNTHIPNMAFLQPANLKSQSKRHKKRLTDVQMRLLETSFIHDKKLDPERKIQLATDLGLPPRQVAVWYQNKRARWKTQALELDYKTLRVRHDNLATEKRLLEKEVERLKGELERAQEILRLNDNLFSSFPSSSDEDGRPALGMDLNSYWESPGVLQVEEFYPGTMGQVGNSISMIHLPTQLPDVDKFYQQRR